MKATVNLAVIIAITIIAVFFSSCKEDELPTVTTVEVSDITTVSSVVTGSVTSDGGSSISNFGFCVSESNQVPTISDRVYKASGNTNNFAVTLELATDKTYFFRAYAINSLGISYGKVLWFITLGGKAGTDTKVATSIDTTSAVLNGVVEGNHLTTKVWFEYGPSTAYGQKVEVAGTIYDREEVGAMISKLIPKTVYHYRVVAENSLGISLE